MSRRVFGRFCIAGVLMLSSGTARAQFGGFYAGYPQSFVFAGSTPEGDWARGVGLAAYGMGLYNINTAAANSIEADTWMRLNQYIYESAREQARIHRLRLALEQQRRTQAREKRSLQIIDHPEPADIYRGDTLNALAWAIGAMRIQHSAQRMSRVSLPGGSLEKVPLVHASTRTVFSLARLDVKGRWPVLLRDPSFAQARHQYETSIDVVLSQVTGRKLSRQALDALEQAVATLMLELGAVSSQANPVDRRVAEEFLEQLSETARTLRHPHAESVLAEVMDYWGTSVADLLTFLERNDLQFGPAKTPAERELYEKLHTLLVEHRGRLSSLLARN
jgi:hypothetical protein